jgi:glycosyltransferase involved in cell wall biosynthesis
MAAMKSRGRLAILDPVGMKAGMDHYDLGLARGLAELGNEVNIHSNFTSDESHVRSFKSFGRGEVRWWNLAALYFRYLQVLRKCKTNHVGTLIIHLFHFNQFDAWLVRKARRMGFYLIGIVHDVEGFVRPTNNRRLLNIVQHGLDRMVVHNRYSRDELLRISGNKLGEKIRVIPHGQFAEIPGEEAPVAGKESFRVGQEKEFTILFFGMIKPTKGLETVIGAMASLPPDVKLLVAGRTRPGMKGSVIRDLQALEREGRARLFLHSIPPEAVSSFFQSADVVVLPYSRVYQSGVLLRAWCEGIPVVLSDLPAFREVATEGSDALFVPAGDRQALMKAVMRLKDDGSLRLSLSEGGRKRLVRDHNWKDIAREFSNLLA